MMSRGPEKRVKLSGLAASIRGRLGLRRRILLCRRLGRFGREGVGLWCGGRWIGRRLRRPLWRRRLLRGLRCGVEHGGAEDGGHGIGYVLAGEVGGGAVHGFEEGGGASDGGGGQDFEAA